VVVQPVPLSMCVTQFARELDLNPKPALLSLAEPWPRCVSS